LLLAVEPGDGRAVLERGQDRNRTVIGIQVPGEQKGERAGIELPLPQRAGCGDIQKAVAGREQVRFTDRVYAKLHFGPNGVQRKAR
jgi:hypothetical protein